MAKTKKLLALDLDGVVFDFMGRFLEIHNITHDTRVTSDDILKFMPDGAMEDIISEDDWNTSFEHAENSGIYATLASIEGARTAIEHIAAAGWDIVYVTSRHSKFAPETELSIILNRIPKHKVYYTPKGKLRKLRQLKPDVFVDDAIRNCEDAEKAGIKKIYIMEAAYNREEYRFERISNLIQLERELIKEIQEDETDG
jgi:HAD superfamily hydrolase (TIGR01509 family)